MFISGKEIVTVDNREYIRVSDAMEIIAPTASNAARWFKQHQEAFSPETFIFSNERFPGKKNRIWLTVPEGFQTFAQACIKAPRLKVLEGVEERIKPFDVELQSYVEESDTVPPNGPPETLDDFFGRQSDLDIVFEGEGVEGEGVSLSKPSHAQENRQIEPVEISIKTVDEVARLQSSQEDGRQSKIRRVEPVETTQYPMPEEKIYGMGTPPTPYHGGVDKEAWTKFLTRSISTLAKGYHAKMEWLDKMNSEAPVELHNPIVDLYKALHDTLVDSAIEDILKFPVKVDDRGKILEYFEQCLKKGYKISLESVREGIFCSVLSTSGGANFIGRTWQEAFETAAEQILRGNHRVE